MTRMANTAQSEAWNGDSGRRWVARADERDRVLAPVADLLFATDPPSLGSDVLDIGCGCGATTLIAAGSVGDQGTATGLDLSAPMLDLARHPRQPPASPLRASFAATRRRMGSSRRRSTSPSAGSARCSSRIPLPRSPTSGRRCDRVDAFTSQRGNRSRRTSGSSFRAQRSCATPSSRRPRPTSRACSLGGPETVTATLTAAGFENVRLDPHEVTLTLGQTIDEAVDRLADSGPGRVLLETIPEGPARDAALADVRDVLVDHVDDNGVHLGASVWLITAS